MSSSIPLGDANAHAHADDNIITGPGPAVDHYHEDDLDGDSDSLWDELSHQQSREIQQHHNNYNQSQKQHNMHSCMHNPLYTPPSLPLPSNNNHTPTPTHGGIHMNMNLHIPLDGEQIRQTFQHTTAAISSAAGMVQTRMQPAANSIQRNVNDVRDRIQRRQLHQQQYQQQLQQQQHTNGNQGSINYMGPYSNNRTVDSPCRDFGLHPSADNLNMYGDGNGSGSGFGHGRSQSFDNIDPFLGASGIGNTGSQRHDPEHHGTPLLLADYGDVDSESLMHPRTRTSTSINPMAENGNMNTSGGMDGNGGSNANENTSEKKFVFLDQFRLLPKRDGWGAVANLDLFLTSLYHYYYHRGIVPIIGKGVVELISLFFTLWLSVFLFQYLDWRKLWNCRDEESCEANLADYIIDKPFASVSIWNFLIVLYILLFTAYGLFAISTFLTSIRQALEAKHIYEDKLGFSARKLEGGAVEWHEICQKILQLQHSGEWRIAIHGQDIKDELVVAQRILRRENFMIAFFNRGVGYAGDGDGSGGGNGGGGGGFSSSAFSGSTSTSCNQGCLLDLTIPMPWKTQNGGRSETKFYSKSLEWSIYFCVLSYMFNHKYQIRPAFCMDPVSLQRRFIFCGIAHIIFMPFLLFFMTLHFSMQNLYDFRSSKQYLGPKEWSSTAKWIFREFNELPHVFEKRIDPSYEATDAYMQLFAPSSLMNSLGRILVFLSGSLGAVCVALAAVNDAILLHVKLGNWNLLWYVGVLGVVYSAGQGMMPNNTVIPRTHHNLFAEMDSALAKIASHTHYYPEFWKKRGWDNIIKSAVSELFQYKLQLFALEVASIVVAPIILCHSLPRRAADICSFVQKVKVEVNRTGDHCGFATFDFDVFEDEDWEGPSENHNNEANRRSQSGTSQTSASAFHAKRSAVYAKLNAASRPKAKLGKMEKSFFNFKTQHPGWKCSSSGQDLVDRMETYEAHQAIALAHERQHHISAVARQLETLRKIEKEVEESKENGIDDFSPQMNEEYVDREYAHQETGNLEKSIIADNDNNGAQMQREKSVHFKDAETLGQNFGDASRGLPSKSNLSALASVMYHDELGLSTELQRVLNRSTLDPGASLFGPSHMEQSLPSLSYLGQNVGLHSSRNEETEHNREQLLQRRYMWLDKYHSQMRSQHERKGGDIEEDIIS